jgi:prevent-host-death family protein
MERVGVRELRQNLSRYLRIVERGVTLEVTERGEPVALLTPLSRGPLARLSAEGRLLRPPRAPLSTLRPPPPVARGNIVTLQKALEIEREERL